MLLALWIVFSIFLGMAFPTTFWLAAFIAMRLTAWPSLLRYCIAIGVIFFVGYVVYYLLPSLLFDKEFRQTNRLWLGIGFIGGLALLQLAAKIFTKGQGLFKWKLQEPDTD